MKILVLGGNRFFGKRLVNLLLENGHKVSLLNRGVQSDEFGSQVQRICLDRNHLLRDGCQIIGDHYDIVFDQICYNASQAQEAVKFFSSRTQKYVFTSSQSVYDSGFRSTESDFNPYEYRFTGEANHLSHYNEAKRQAESVFFQQSTLPVMAVRFPIVLGEDDYTQRLKFHVERIKDGKEIYFPNLSGELSFIHAQDAAQFLFSVTEKFFNTPINVCAPEPIIIEKLIEMLEKQLHKKCLLAESANSENQSPFGMLEHFSMNTDRLQSHQIAVRRIDEWLPNLINEI